MTRVAHGTFDVNITPQPPEDKSKGLTLGRMLIEKEFHGDLEAASKGQMLTGMTEVKGSGAYVAMERVTGMLDGRVVPDSGSRELAGIAGTMTIIIADGKHAYDFAYTLPGEP